MVTGGSGPGACGSFTGREDRGEFARRRCAGLESSMVGRELSRKHSAMSAARWTSSWQRRHLLGYQRSIRGHVIGATSVEAQPPQVDWHRPRGRSRRRRRWRGGASVLAPVVTTNRMLEPVDVHTRSGTRGHSRCRSWAARGHLPQGL